MPVTKTAKKALRNAQNKQTQNTILKRKIEIALKKASSKSYSSVVSLIDKAAKNNLISANKASREKSKLTRRLNIKKATKRETAGETIKKAKTVKTKKSSSKITKK